MPKIKIRENASMYFEIESLARNLTKICDKIAFAAKYPSAKKKMFR